jgi:hypothetical protein
MVEAVVRSWIKYLRPNPAELIRVKIAFHLRKKVRAILFFEEFVALFSS